MDKFRLQSSRALVLMVGILLLTMLYGSYRLNDDPLWVDEVISMQRAGLVDYVDDTSPAAVWQRTALISDQVPLYYILFAQWGNIVGTSPYALRVLSLFFGVLSVALVYQIGKNLLSKMAGVAFALILSSSAFYMLFLHEMRTYALLVCLIALLIWCYWLITHHKATLWAQIGLVVAARGMMYSYYLSIVVIVTLCLYHLIFIKKDREWWRIVGLMALAGLLFLPWLLTSFSVFVDPVRNSMRTIHTTDFIAALEKVGSAFSNQNIMGMLFLMAFAIQLRQAWSRFAWFIGLSCLTLMIVLNEPLGVFVNLRYSLLLWIPLAILTGLGVDRLVRLGVSPYMLCAVILVSGFVSNFSEELEQSYDLPIRYLPWDILVDTLQPYQQTGDTMTFIALIEGDDWEGVHEERVMPHYFHDSLIEPVFVEDVRNLTDEGFLRDATLAAQSANRIWLSYDPALRSWRTGLFEDELLRNNFNLCGNFVNSDELYLDLYAHPRAMSDSPKLIFGDENASAALALIQPIPATVAGSNLHLIHTWALSDAFPRSQYSLALHVVDANGNLITQADYGLPLEAFDCVQTLIPLDDLPIGTYQIRSFVYQWQDGTRLPVLETQNSSDDFIVLGEFEVTR